MVKVPVLQFGQHRNRFGKLRKKLLHPCPFRCRIIGQVNAEDEPGRFAGRDITGNETQLFSGKGMSIQSCIIKEQGRVGCLPARC